MERWREDFHQKGKIYQQDAEADHCCNIQDGALCDNS